MAFMKPSLFCWSKVVHNICLSLFTGRVVVVVGASGSRSNRQAGSKRVEHEPALPRVRGAELAAPALARGGVCGQRARLST